MNRRHLIAAAASLPLSARAQAPDVARTVRLVVPFAAGGAIDVQARALAGPLSAALGGRPVVVLNRPGGATRVATDEVKRAAPDGTTVLLMPPFGWVGYFHSGAFDTRPWIELTPIAQYAETPYSLVLSRGDGPLLDWAALRTKGQRDGITMGAPAAGGIAEFAFQQMLRAGGMRGTFVPYRGGGPAVTALAAGEVDTIILTMGDGFPLLGDGRGRGIALSAAARSPRAPSVPTFAELGVPFTLSNIFVLWGPPGLPAAAVAPLSDALRVAIADPAVRTVLEDRFAFSLGYRPGAEAQADAIAFDREWGPRLAASGG
jgi:tripartite-type tricarboxylate transporter receptor subunit TctC